jgi:hypothetical protein
MLKDIILIVSGCVAGLVILYSKNFLNKYIKSLVVNGKSATTEQFSWKKFVAGMIDVGNPVQWAKEFAFIFNARKMLLIGLIIGLIYGYGWYKGKQGVQPVLNWNDGKEHWVSLNEHYLHVTPGGTMEVVSHDKKTILKKISVKDIPELAKALRPYGLDLKPFITLGSGAGATGIALEGGAGLQIFKWFKWYYNIFLTNKALYPIGISYKITDNFDIIGGLGQEYKGGQRIYIGGKWKF